MANTLRSWILVAALLALTVASWWLLERLGLGLSRHETKPHEPDYYMEGMVTRELDDQGRPRRGLRAELMLHYPDDKSVELVKPRMEIHNNKGLPPWRIRSERGWINNGNEFAMLYGAVEIWRDQTDGSHDVVITTRDLRVLPKDDYAESDAFTTIKTLTSEHRGTGIKANLRNNRVYLLSRVWSRYESTQSAGHPPPP